MMNNILLIRAGKTDFDLQGRVQGTIDLPLCTEGWKEVTSQAEQLADHSIDAIYAGPELATQQTAELVAEKFGMKVKTQKNLHNLDLGLWQGMLIEEVKTKQPRVYRQWLEHPETVCPPEGETLQSAFDRLSVSLAKIQKKNKSGTIALVLAEPMATLLCHLLRGSEVGDLWQGCQKKRPLWELISLSEQVAVASTDGVASFEPPLR